MSSSYGLGLNLRSRFLYQIESCRPYVVRSRARLWNWHRLIVTFWSCIAFAAGLGASLLVFGPTLLDLATHLSVGVGILSIMFACRAVGSAIGSVSSGVILDKYASCSYTILSIIIFFCMATTAILPLSIHAAMLGAFMFLNGIATGGLDNGAHAVLMRLWGNKSGLCMQTFHFSWAFGAFVAPLIAKCFIQDETDDGELSNNMTCLDIWMSLSSPMDSMTTQVTGSYSEATNLDCISILAEACKNLTYVLPMQIKELNLTDFNCTTTSDTELSSRFMFAYFMTASLFLPPLAAFIFYAVRREYFGRCCSKPQTEVSTSKSKPEAEGELPSKYPLCYVIILFTLIFSFTFLYVGLAHSFGSLIFTVSVTGKLGFSKSSAALLQAVFWGGFAFARLVAVFLAFVNVRASIMMMGNLFGSFVASLIMTFYVHNSTAIWIGAAVLGMSYASIFPTMMTWISENAKATGITALRIVAAIVPLITLKV